MQNRKIFASIDAIALRISMDMEIQWTRFWERSVWKGIKKWTVQQTTEISIGALTIIGEYYLRGNWCR